jgi:glycosyltransferase involved in cell wall biosynthesis
MTRQERSPMQPWVTAQRRAQNRRVLMIAYHYPPYSGSSGVQRTLGFARYLPEYGWDPVILTAHERAYPHVGGDQRNDSPPSVPVKRAFALDTAKHLGFRGRYLKWLALPDRWASWFLGAVVAGLALVRKHKPAIIWSTYPIATAHLIGFTLHRLTRIPWVADFRDPMNEIDPISNQRWPSDPAIWKARGWVERVTVNYCSRAVFVAPTAQRIYSERYATLPADRWVIITNGYDEPAFLEAEHLVPEKRTESRCTVLVHSGTLYPSPDRDPRCLFAALVSLKASGKISPVTLKIILRGTGYDEYYRNLIDEYGIADIVALEPAQPYRMALAEMLASHGLLLIQGRDSNPAIPAKFYEYLRAKRPIFAMVDLEGDTAGALRAAEVGKIVPLTSQDAIANGLLDFLDDLWQNRAPIASATTIQKFSRRSQTGELASVLSQVTD